MEEQAGRSATARIGRPPGRGVPDGPVHPVAARRLARARPEGQSQRKLGRWQRGAFRRIRIARCRLPAVPSIPTARPRAVARAGRSQAPGLRRGRPPASAPAGPEVAAGSVGGRGRKVTGSAGRGLQLSRSGVPRHSTLAECRTNAGRLARLALRALVDPVQVAPEQAERVAEPAAEPGAAPALRTSPGRPLGSAVAGDGPPGSRAPRSGARPAERDGSGRPGSRSTRPGAGRDERDASGRSGSRPPRSGAGGPESRTAGRPPGRSTPGGAPGRSGGPRSDDRGRPDRGTWRPCWSGPGPSIW